MNKSEHPIWTGMVVRGTLYTPEGIKRVGIARVRNVALVIEEDNDGDGAELARIPFGRSDGWQAILGKVKRWARDNGWRLRPR